MIEQRTRFRISLTTIFAFVAILAVYLVVMIQPQGFVNSIALSMVNCLIVVAIVAGIVYGHGGWRAFAIGSAIPAVGMLIMAGPGMWLGWGMHNSTDFRPNLIAFHAYIILSGLAMIFFRWVLQRPGK